MRVTAPSTCPWLDHPVSGLMPQTKRPIKTRFRCAYASRLKLACNTKSLTHYTKGTRSRGSSNCFTICVALFVHGSFATQNASTGGAPKARRAIRTRWCNCAAPRLHSAVDTTKSLLLYHGQIQLSSTTTTLVIEARPKAAGRSSRPPLGAHRAHFGRDQRER